MDDFLGVRRGEPMRHFDRVLDGLVHRQRSARDPCSECLAAQQLGHRVPEASLGADVVKGQDVRMAQGGNRLRFLGEEASLSGSDPNVSSKTLMATSRFSRLSLAR